MEFLSFTLAADLAIEKFNCFIAQNQTSEINILINKILLSNYHVLLIAQQEPIVERIKPPWKKSSIIALHKDWCEIGKNSENVIAQEKTWKKISAKYGYIPQKKKGSSSTLRKYFEDQNNNSFVLLLTGKEEIGLPMYEISYLSNLFQLEQGKVQLHTAAIVHGKSLFLFGGPSGAGKSTVSAFSNNQRDMVIDEDTILLSKKNGTYVAQGWGYSLQSSPQPLRAIFKLIKDTDDRLLKISQRDTSRFLFDRSMDIIGNMVDPIFMKRVFHQVSNIAKQVPGFELHFRNSPDFWKLIETELGFD